MTTKLKYDEKNYFAVKKIRVTFILSILVFVLHLGITDKYQTTSGNNFWYEITMGFEILLRAFATIAVPLFFIISAALFYRDYTPPPKNFTKMEK